MVISDVGKLAAMLVVIAGLFAVVLAGKATMEQVDQYFLLVIGYLVGNGVNVVRRRAPSSVIVPKVHDDEVLTINGSYPAKLENNGPSDNG